MKWLALSLAALLWTQPALADNFEFVVPGDAGLSLTVTGYDRGGTQMFEASAREPEVKNGVLSYIVRIDDSILRAAPLGRWCVEDPSGKWSLLTDGAKGLCDDQPSETRGSYGFRPTSVFAAATPSPGTDAQPQMTAIEAAMCVQDTLNRLGFDAGTVDGKMGRRTFDAALTFAIVQEELYPDLSDASAATWCSTMRSAEAKGAIQAKPNVDVATFQFGPDIDVATAVDTRRGIQIVDEFFKSAFGSALKSPGTVYVSSDANWLADSYVSHLRANKGVRREKVEWFAGCHGGEAGYGFLFMCASSDVFSGDWFGSGHAAQRSYALAHEYFHMLQYERAVGSLKGCCSGDTLKVLGPQWLVEGAAEYIAVRLLGDSGKMDFKREIDWHTQKAAEVKSTLEKMQTRKGYYAEQRASSSGMIAAHLLAEKSGLGSLADFYSELGKGGGWARAFEAAFGVTPDAFYASYDDYIHGATAWNG